MPPHKKHDVRTIVAVSILGALCLIGLIFAPRQTAGSVIILTIFTVTYLVQKRKMGNVVAQTPVPTSPYRQMSALSSLILGLIGFLCIPFVWGVGFAAISLFLAVLVISSGRHNNQRPSITSAMSSAMAMSILGLILSCMTFVFAAFMYSTSSWPVDPTMFVRGVFAN